MNPPIVDTNWLEKNLDNSKLVLIDASVDKVVGKQPIEYQQFSCLPNSVHCDLKVAFHDAASTQPNTMPTPKQFEQQAQKLGINNDSIIVIYDNQGIYSAPRAWWMFKAMGLEQVYVLNGGLPIWLDEQRAISDSYRESTLGTVSAKYNSSMLSDAYQVLGNIKTDDCKIVDARGPARFSGTTKEPRPGLRSGHIPSSINIHFAQLLTEDGLKYKEEAELKAIFVQAKIDISTQIIASCGSGMTACIVLLAAYSLGYKNLSLYDGSWSEWGANQELPVEV